MGSSLKTKAVEGISWNLIERAGVNGIRLIIGIILARLLLPDDFGLIAMITVFFSIAQVFVNSGFGQAYVQKKEVTEEDANTVFIINLTISSLIYFLLYITSPYIADFYDETQLVNLTRILGLVVIINSFNIIQIAQLRRELKFKKKALTSLSSVILSGIAGISFALSGFGVWSLVFQQLSNRLFLTIGLYYTSSWKFKIQFSSESFKNLFSFGGWLLAANIMKKIFDNIYRIAIGRFFPAYELGYFSKSKQFQGVITEQFVWAINMVSFPVFSKVQDQQAKINTTFIKFIKSSSFFIIPLLSILLVISEPFIHLLLTEKWAAMVPYLQLLCVVGMIQPLYDLSNQSLQAIGKSKLVFKLGMVKNILRLINIAIFYEQSVQNIIIGEIAIACITYFLNSFFTNKYIKLSLYKQINALKLIFIGAVLSIVSGYCVLTILNNLWLKLFIPSIIMAITYILVIYFLDKDFIKEIYTLTNNLLFKRKLRF